MSAAVAPAEGLQRVPSCNVPASPSAKRANVKKTPVDAKKVSTLDIQQVQNLIEGCLQKYMCQREVVQTLQSQSNIDPGFTMLVWQKLEEQNPEFFKAYYIRLKVKDQIVMFNSLLDLHCQTLQKLHASWAQAFPAMMPHAGMPYIFPMHSMAPDMVMAGPTPFMPFPGTLMPNPAGIGAIMTHQAMQSQAASPIMAIGHQPNMPLPTQMPSTCNTASMPISAPLTDIKVKMESGMAENASSLSEPQPKQLQMPLNRLSSPAYMDTTFVHQKHLHDIMEDMDSDLTGHNSSSYELQQSDEAYPLISALSDENDDLMDSFKMFSAMDDPDMYILPNAKVSCSDLLKTSQSYQIDMEHDTSENRDPALPRLPKSFSFSALDTLEYENGAMGMALDVCLLDFGSSGFDSLDFGSDDMISLDFETLM